MKKLFLHIAVSLGSAFLLCILAIGITSIGKGQTLLSMDDQYNYPSESTQMQSSLDSSDSQAMTEEETELSTEPSTQTPPVTETESQETTETQDMTETSTQETPPPINYEDLVVDDEEATADDEYDTFAIANKIKANSFVNVRLNPSTEAEVIGRMYPGSVAQILDYVGEGEDLWIKMISGNLEGYINSRYFTYGTEAALIIDQYTTKIAVVNCDTLHVRTGPSTDYGFAGYLERDEKVPIVGYDGDWLKVLYADNTQESYIHSKYVYVIEDYVTAKSLEEIALQESHAQELIERLDQNPDDIVSGDTQDAGNQNNGQNSEQNNEQTNNDSNNESCNESNNNQTNNDQNEAPQPPAPNTDSLDELRQSIVNYALQFVGNPYVSGGQSLTNGTDCSGFTCYVYKDFGYYISRTPGGQLSGDGISVSRDDLKPGDIICYETYTSGVCSHVGMYIGDGMIVHAANRKKGIVVSNIDIHTILGIKRIVY